jgi:hypothetical protein
MAQKLATTSGNPTTQLETYLRQMYCFPLLHEEDNSVRLCVAFNCPVFRRMDAEKVPTTRAIKQIVKTVGIRR